MSDPRDVPTPDTVGRILLAEELCDRYEDRLRAGDRLTPAEFLRGAGVEAGTVPPELVRELGRIRAAYRGASLPAPASAPLKLVVTAGPLAGREFAFTGPGTFLIGRSTRAQFLLPSGDTGDLRVSHAHCLVEFGPAGCRVHDLNSHNGTFVGGKRVTTADLTDGADLRVGRTVMRVELAADRPPETIDWPGDAPAPKPAARKVSKPAAKPRPKSAPRPTAAVPDKLFEATTVKPAPPRRGSKPPKPTAPVAPLPQCPACRGPAVAGETICTACADAADELEQPFPGYRLIREVGRGGMGVVYLAWHDATRSPVAIKEINPVMALKPTQVERFVREIEILKQLDHPAIVGFRDAGYAAGSLFLAMEFVHGKSAAAAVKTHKQIAEPVAVSLVCQLLEALDHAHGRGFVHRDVKPGNLMLHVAAPGKLGVKLTDFGLARVYDSSQLSGLTVADDVAGTTSFMAPEQILDLRNVKPAADQYGAAACLYKLLTGKYVYNQSRFVADQLRQILDEDPVPILGRKPDVSPGLAGAIMTALSRDPADRFADVEAFRRAIRPFAG